MFIATVRKSAYNLTIEPKIDFLIHWQSLNGANLTMKNIIRHSRRVMDRLNEAWEAGFRELLEQMMRGYERLTGKKREPAPVPVPERRYPANTPGREQ